MKLNRWAMGVAALVLAASTGAHAAPFTAALTYSDGGTTLGNGPYSLGYEFTTNAAFDIDALGIYDPNNGLIDSHAIGLWDSGGNLLASTTIAAPGGSFSVAGFDYNSIATVSLAAGGDYFIAAEYDTANDPVLFPGYGGSYSFDPRINYVQSTYGNPTGFANNGYGVNGFFGPNMGIAAAVSAAPEPGTWALMLIGLGALGGALRLRRRQLAGVVAA